MKSPLTRPIRLLAISHDSSLYGAQRSLLDLLKNLPVDSFCPIVLLPNPGEVNAILKSLKIETIILDYLWWIPTKYFHEKYYGIKYILKVIPSVFNIVKIIKKYQIQVVYTNTVTVLDGAIAAKLCGIPHIWHIRESIDENDQIASVISNNIASKVISYFSNSIIFNSQYLKNLYSMKHQQRIKVIYNGVECDQNTKVAARHLHRNSVISISTIGFVEYRKGLDILLDALLLVAQSGYDFSLVVAGDVDKVYFSNEIEHRLENPVLANRVRMLGWVSNVKDILNTTDILVSSARQEPFGRTIIEAMSLGVPVVSTKSGGPNEIISHRENGILVEKDPMSLANALITLIEDPILTTNISRNSITTTINKFSIDSYVTNISNEISYAADLSISGI